MMYYRIVPDTSSFKLHRSPDPTEDRKILGRAVSDTDINSCIDRKSDTQLRPFFVAIRILMMGEKWQRPLIDKLSVTRTPDNKIGVLSAVDYLEIYRNPAILKKRIKRMKRNRKEMNDYSKLNKLLRSVYAPVKEELRLPAVNMSAHSFTVPDTLVPTITSGDCKNYLKFLVTCGTITEYKYEIIKTKLRKDYPDNASQIIKAMDETRSNGHLSAISFNDSRDQLVVSIVNVNGDQLQLEGYKFLRLIEEHGKNKGGWLSLGFLNKKDTWLPEPLLTFNKVKKGELVARYLAQESCLDVKCRDVSKPASGNAGITDQALFIIEQDYLVCLYVAIMKLKNDKQRFEELRERAETKEVSNMPDFEADLFT